LTLVPVQGDELVNTVTAIPAAAAPTKVPAADGLIDVRLTAIRYAARDTNLYEFMPLDGKPLPAYEPGAHIDVHLPNGIIRQYSLIEPEPDPKRYTIGVMPMPPASKMTWPEFSTSAKLLRGVLILSDLPTCNSSCT